MTYTARESDAGMRLDSFIAEQAKISRSGAAHLIADGCVKVNNSLPQKSYTVREGDTVEVETLPPKEIAAVPQDIPLDVVFEDDCLLVINKPSGMVVHPAAGNPDGTLVNALLYHCRGKLSGINGELRPGIVHRIDKDTSGLLVVAKTDAAHRGLAEQLSGHRITREYRAILIGNLREDCGTVDMPIGRHPTDRLRMAVIRDRSHTCRDAITHYRVLERYSGYCYAALQLETGRTHQIRVHMAALGHPLLGDGVYGGGSTPFEKRHSAYVHGQCLHAKVLCFKHPLTGEDMRFEVPLPTDFEAVLDILRKK